ncbi:PHP domain-containing protein [Candidatus Woesearchaeota archaeon]|nr:MAG: PHP domain-containing protein [Candidatus Woesearchaeota archaeon]
MEYCDLQIHSTASDGSLTPFQLVKKAKELGLKAISITDHDTIAGLDEAIQAGKEFGVEIIPGVELSVKFHGKEIHLLGYMFDKDNAFLRKKLGEFQKKRVGRIKRIVEKVNSYLVKEGKPTLDFNEMIKGVSGSAARPHLARYMVKKGLVKDWDEAFDKYLVRFNSPKYNLSVEEAVELMAKSGGKLFIAHPGSARKSLTEITPDLNAQKKLIRELAGLGIKGIECYYPDHDEKAKSFYLSTAKELGLLTSGGSDWHGPDSPHSMMGSIKAPYNLILKIKRGSKEHPLL